MYFNDKKYFKFDDVSAGLVETLNNAIDYYSMVKVSFAINS